ncbi:choice-of-anchor Q domain-containing protein [Gimesia sp.]|uniref:choice-of-anchor Q domain-containing protein n=1 Tax=Gimesia sp. TaxID=2024833 RepID=UPI003A909E0E
MFHSQWLTTLNRRLRNRCYRARRARRDRQYGSQTPSVQALVSRNVIETLEDRTLLTAFTVVNTNDSGAGSLRDAIAQANANEGADTITFDAALAGQSIVLSDELWISDDLTLTGLGADQLTLDANRQSRIFEITDNNSQALISVVMSGLSLINGYEFGGDGGAIFNRENLTVLDCTFSNNEVDFDGGSIWNGVDNILNVERCIFSHNEASHGGGIYNISGTLSVSDSSFVGNIASSRGGGISTLSSLGEVYVTNSTFAGNTAEWLGGGIYSEAKLLNVSGSEFSENSARDGAGIYNKKSFTNSFTAKLNVFESRFLDNHASSSGGGIYNREAELTIRNSVFDQNSGFSGGGVYHSKENATIEDSVFTGNSATSGGGIYFSFGIQDESRLISSCVISGNIASSSGGGIYSLNGLITIEDCTISDNSAGMAAGIYASSSELSIFNTTISNNSAAGSGGGIYSVFDPDLRIQNCTISDNQSGVAGGGIYIASSQSSIINCTISGNYTGADSYSAYAGKGGGIYYSGVEEHDVPEILNCTIINNEAVNDGGGVAVYIFDTVRIVNSIVAGNISGSGTQTFAESTSEITGYANIIQASLAGLIDPVLRDNGGPTKTHALLFGSAAIDAGHTFAVASLALTTDQRGTGFFRYENGVVDIGAFESKSLHFLVDSATDIDDGDYSAGNLSLREAIKLSNESDTTDTITFAASLFDQTLIINNELVITDDVTIIGHGAEHLTLSGSGTHRLFRIDDGEAETSISVELSDFTLNNGFANYSSGGAIHSLETLSITDVVFADNQASVLNGPTYGGSYGGAIYSAGDLKVTNSTFLRNTADWFGGAIYSTEGFLRITGCDFTENQTFYAGGAVLVQDGDLTVSSSTFTQNTSDTLGGGIYVTQGVLTVSDTVFTENSSGTGGAIYHQISSTFPPVFTELSITDCIFQGNTTTSIGGAVSYWSELSLYSSFYTAYIENSHFSENSASSGGALYLSGENILVTDSTFIKNSARLNGGGISSYCDNLTIQNSLFEKNSAQAWGGGIYSQRSLVLQNSTLSGNTALVVGGGIAFDYQSYPWEIINSTLTGNAATRIGGGIYAFSGLSGKITNSIVAGNTAPSTPQVLRYVSNTNSIIQDSVAGLLDPVLRDNGGVTKTHALLPGSAAINGGDNDALDDTNPDIINRRAVTQDQRGEGYERIADGTIDIGAFEVQHTLAQIELRVVDVKTTTQNNGEATALPDNLTWIDEWKGYWLEIWISTTAANDLGVLSAAMNLSYNTAITTAVGIEYGAGFTINQTGTINDLTGMIENLSAETDLTDLGDSQHVLFARIRFESTASDGIDLDLAGQIMIPESPEFTVDQTEIQLVGNIATEEVQGTAPETLVFANPYDLNDDDRIDYRDLIQLVSIYGVAPTETASDYGWFADYDQNDLINYRDLIQLVSNYGKSKANQAATNYPRDFPESHQKHLTVEPTLLPQLSATPVEQATAETMLNSVVESLESQLTSAENAKLAQVDIVITDLPQGVLSNTVHGTIYIDVNAAGYGWFVDNTPDDNSEFYETGPFTLYAVPFGSTIALGKIDLRTVFLHELGHLLGYDDADDGAMQASLIVGERRLLDWEDRVDLFFMEFPNESPANSF